MTLIIKFRDKPWKIWLPETIEVNIYGNGYTVTSVTTTPEAAVEPDDLWPEQIEPIKKGYGD